MYFWERSIFAAEKALAVLAEQAQVPLTDVTAQANVAFDEAAVLHLFNIAASLASLVIGEPQVLGQVKAAHRMAKDAGMPAGVIDALFQAAYGAAKRVRTETGIGEGPVSIAAVAVPVLIFGGVTSRNLRSCDGGEREGQFSRKTKTCNNCRPHAA